MPCIIKLHYGNLVFGWYLVGIKMCVSSFSTDIQPVLSMWKFHLVIVFEMKYMKQLKKYNLQLQNTETTCSTQISKSSPCPCYLVKPCWQPYHLPKPCWPFCGNIYVMHCCFFAYCGSRMHYVIFVSLAE